MESQLALLVFAASNLAVFGPPVPAEEDAQMYRTLIATLVALAIVVGLAAPALAGSVTFRSDPNDSSSVLDIRRIGTDLTVKGAYFEVRTWDAFNRDDLKAGGSHSNWFVFRLNPTRTRNYTTAVFMYYRRRWTCEVLHWPETLVGKRKARHSDNRDLNCRVPVSWLDLHGKVRFIVRSERDLNLEDRAPNHGKYGGF
jgi:hypothetical protein